MKELKLNIYKNGKVVKTSTAQAVDLEFGTVRSLMELLKVESIDDTAALLKTVYSAWEEITGVLGQVFPDMEEEDWQHVKVKELLPILVDVLRYSFAEMLTIPTDSKN